MRKPMNMSSDKAHCGAYLNITGSTVERSTTSTSRHGMAIANIDPIESGSIKWDVKIEKICSGVNMWMGMAEQGSNCEQSLDKSTGTATSPFIAVGCTTATREFVMIGYEYGYYKRVRTTLSEGDVVSFFYDADNCRISVSINARPLLCWGHRLSLSLDKASWQSTEHSYSP